MEGMLRSKGPTSQRIIINVMRVVVVDGAGGGDGVREIRKKLSQFSHLYRQQSTRDLHTHPSCSGW